MTPAIAKADDSQSTVQATVRVNPLTVDLLISDSSATAGQYVLITVLVRNHGDTRVRDVDLALHMSEEPCLEVIGSTPSHRSVLRGGGTFLAIWLVKAVSSGPACENVVVAAAASAVDVETGEVMTAESLARVIKIRMPPPRPCKGLFAFLRPECQDR
jgi:hypothetical protein